MWRLCIWNVHGWSDALYQPNRERVFALLSSLDCDVIALNEALGERVVRALAERLGMHCAFVDADFSANTILSKAAPTRIERVMLRSGSPELRCAVSVAFEEETKIPSICCTHLDHRKEGNRVTQLKQLLAYVKRSFPDALVCGDFNALRLTDYPAERLEELRSLRVGGHWEEPREAVTDLMDRSGYLDTLRLARAGSLAAYRTSLSTALSERDQSSCWAGTRIDYGWLPAATTPERRVTRAEILLSDASDHSPQLFEFEP